MESLEYIVDYNSVARKVALRKEILFSMIETDVREAILRMSPSQTLSFRICHNSTYKEVPMAANERYAKVLWAFLHNDKYEEEGIIYDVESIITYPILNQVRDSIVNFYSSQEIKESIVAAISESVQTSNIVQAAVGSSVDETRKAIRKEIATRIANNTLSGVKHEAADQITDQVVSFMNSSMMQQILDTLETVLTASAGKIIAAKLVVVLSHAIPLTALKSIVLSVIKKVGVASIAKTVVGKSIIILLGAFGLSSTAASTVVLIPLIGIFMVHEYKSFPQKLANKVPSQVVKDVSDNFDRMNNLIIRRIMSELSKQISKKQSDSKPKKNRNTWKHILSWIILMIVLFSIGTFAISRCINDNIQEFERDETIGNLNTDNPSIDNEEDLYDDIIEPGFFTEEETIKDITDKIQIEYYVKEDKDSYLSLAKELYSMIDGEEHKVSLPDDICLEIIAQDDFDGDGIKDALIKHIVACGGNMCGQSYFFVSYKGDGRFTVTNSFADDIYREPIIENWKGRKSVVIEYFDREKIQEVKKRFVYEDGEVSVVETIKSEKIDAIKEIIASDIRDDRVVRLTYDLDENGINDYIDCECFFHYSYYDLISIKITLNGVTLDDIGCNGIFRIGVAGNITNGLHDLILNDNHIVKWDGEKYFR